MAQIYTAISAVSTLTRRLPLMGFSAGGTKMGDGARHALTGSPVKGGRHYTHRVHCPLHPPLHKAPIPMQDAPARLQNKLEATVQGNHYMIIVRYSHDGRYIDRCKCIVDVHTYPSLS